MSLKEIARIFGLRKEKINKSTLNENAPTVIIDDKRLAVTLGQWLGCLPDSVKSSGNGLSVITSINADELLKRYFVSKDQLEDISIRMANLFEQIGIWKDNTCVLNNFDEENLGFNCLFRETGQVAEMYFKFGQWLDSLPRLIVEFDGIKTDYDLHKGYSDDDEYPAQLIMNTEEKELDDRGFVKFRRIASDYRYNACVYDRDDKVEIEIEYPNGGLTSDENPYVDEKVMEEALSEVSLIPEMDYICKQIESGLKLPVNSYNINITIKKRKQVDGKIKEEVSDKLRYSLGQILEFVTTRNGRKVRIDYYGNWSIDSYYYTISQNMEDTISYTLKCIATKEDELTDALSAQEAFKEAKTEMQQVKVLSKQLFPQKKQGN